MMLTYNEALATIIDYTEIGYTVASQDRLWIVFTFDTWSTDEFRYNRIYTRGIGNGWAYDLDIEALVWTSRREAEKYAEALRARGQGENYYVMNLGDDARLESLFIGRDNRRRVRDTPKFKGSEEAWSAMIEMSLKWREANR